jgi:hypothetical protein
VSQFGARKTHRIPVPCDDTVTTGGAAATASQLTKKKPKKRRDQKLSKRSEGKSRCPKWCSQSGDFPPSHRS